MAADDWPPQSIDPASLKGIVVDDLDNLYGMQDWFSRSDGKFVRTCLSGGAGQVRIHDFVYSVNLPESGEYEVRYAYASAPERASRLPITVLCASGQALVRLEYCENLPRSMGYGSH